jgi:hypothetical protein
MISRVLVVIACFVQLTISQRRDADTGNPICYVCSDDGVSTITKPDVIVPLPNNTQGVSEATCETIRLSAEVLLLIPEESCHLLDNENFRIVCGCENALNATVTMPAAAPVAVPTPVLAPSTIPVESDSPVTTVPTIPLVEPPTEKPVAPDVPETGTPSAAPISLISSQPSSISSSVPSSISSSIQSDALSETPSTTLSSVPSNVASSVPSN